MDGEITKSKKFLENVEGQNTLLLFKKRDQEIKDEKQLKDMKKKKVPHQVEEKFDDFMQQCDNIRFLLSSIDNNEKKIRSERAEALLAINKYNQNDLVNGLLHQSDTLDNINQNKIIISSNFFSKKKSKNTDILNFKLEKSHYYPPSHLSNNNNTSNNGSHHLQHQHHHHHHHVINNNLNNNNNLNMVTSTSSTGEDHPKDELLLSGCTLKPHLLVNEKLPSLQKIYLKNMKKYSNAYIRANNEAQSYDNKHNDSRSNHTSPLLPKITLHNITNTKTGLISQGSVENINILTKTHLKSPLRSKFSHPNLLQQQQHHPNGLARILVDGSDLNTSNNNTVVINSSVKSRLKSRIKRN